ncbi:hypothetical protein DUI87_11206 [Hirundo rustica rustica]|uniref:Uncharacterized protein n=1 Tax=Hirundo rustica rustica TaxID=333673 RepID=A0A3M0KHJ1_HIRRU|nr:hypothetical protein DUI87_11206 [Hirundo rustica rustica]
MRPSSSKNPLGLKQNLKLDLRMDMNLHTALVYSACCPCVSIGVGQSWLWCDLIETFQRLNWCYLRAWDGSPKRACSDKSRVNGSKLKQERFRLDTKKKFFILEVARHWNRMPREAVDALSLVKAMLDGALSNLVQWKVSLSMAGELEPSDL